MGTVCHSKNFDPVFKPKVKEQKKVTRLDRKKLRPSQELYIALANMDFTWYKHEVQMVINHWKEGWHIAKIAHQLNRDADEVAVLLIDLGRKGRICERAYGVFGGVTGGA